MPFGLTNMQASFQDMINHILKHLLDNVVILYIDNILIYTKHREPYDKLVEEVLEKLAKNDLVILHHKYIQAKHEVEFLGYIIPLDGIKIAKDNTEAI
jgi:hypothetical protein